MNPSSKALWRDGGSHVDAAGMGPLPGPSPQIGAGRVSISFLRVCHRVVMDHQGYEFFRGVRATAYNLPGGEEEEVRGRSQTRPEDRGEKATGMGRNRKGRDEPGLIKSVFCALLVSAGRDVTVD